MISDSCVCQIRRSCHRSLTTFNRQDQVLAGIAEYLRRRSAASSDLFDSWPERVQRMESQASGPSSCRIGETVCPDDSGRQGLAASRLSGYASEVHRDVNSTFGSVTPCASRGSPLDLSVRWGNTRSQSPAGRDSTQHNLLQ